MLNSSVCGRASRTNKTTTTPICYQPRPSGPPRTMNSCLANYACNIRLVRPPQPSLLASHSRKISSSPILSSFARTTPPISSGISVLRALPCLLCSEHMELPPIWDRKWLIGWSKCSPPTKWANKLSSEVSTWWMPIWRRLLPGCKWKIYTWWEWLLCSQLQNTSRSIPLSWVWFTIRSPGKNSRRLRFYRNNQRLWRHWHSS
jgi:hypothetical protein